MNSNSRRTTRAYFVIVNNTMFEKCINFEAQFTLQADKAFKTTDFHFALSIARQFPGASIRSADAVLGPPVVVGSDHNHYIL